MAPYLNSQLWEGGGVTRNNSAFYGWLLALACANINTCQNAKIVNNCSKRHQTPAWQHVFMSDADCKEYSGLVNAEGFTQALPY